MEWLKKKVLIVDDSTFMQAHIQTVIEQKDLYEVIGTADSGATAKSLTESLRPDIITLDNILPDILGMRLIPFFKKTYPTTKLLVISAVNQKQTVQEVFNLGADGFLEKPFKDASLHEQLQLLYVASSKKTTHSA